MISKNDLLLLLTDLQNKGIDTSEAINKLIASQNIPLEVLKFINDNRQLDVLAFYEQLRKNYNKKKSPLYINIVKEDFTDPNKVLTTLSAMLTQILLYSKRLENKNMFLRHVRAKEISNVLQMYFTNYDLTNCIRLLRLIKIDLKTLESIK